jgi:chaperone modulatory protein CbpM
MKIEVTEYHWPERQELTFAELLELSGLTPAELQELISGGAIAALDETGHETHYNALALLRARTARRLRDDFELNTSGILLAITLLTRIDELEHESSSMRARQPMFPTTRLLDD